MVGPFSEDAFEAVSQSDPTGQATPTGGRSSISAVHQALDALLAFVRSAPSGTRLPPERELASRFGVSRTTLRSAVDRLSLLGYLDVRHGSGTLTRRPGPELLAEPFTMALADVPGSAAEVYAVRLLLEPTLAAYAARRAEAASRASLRRALSGADSAFHILLASRSGNAVATQLVGVLVGLSAAVAVVGEASASEARVIRRQHSAVVDAVAEGDPDLARESMRLHLRWEARRVKAART